jgi:methyl-accepting chemotaxis protein
LLWPGIALIQKLGNGGKMALILPIVIAPISYLGGTAIADRWSLEVRHSAWVQSVSHRAEPAHLAAVQWHVVSPAQSDQPATQSLDSLSLHELPALWRSLRPGAQATSVGGLVAAAAQWSRVEALLHVADGVLVRAPTLQALLGVPDAASSQASATQITAARLEVAQLQQLVVKAQSQALAAEHEGMHRSNVWFTALSALLLFTLGYLMAAYTVQARSRRKNILQQVNKMAEGDFSGRVDVVGEDDVAQTLQSINKSSMQICELLSTVLRGSAAIQHAAEQLSMGNNDLSERNRRTTLGLEDVVGAVARYASQLEACGKQIESVADTVQVLRCDAASNRKHMGRLQTRMNELRKHSRDIGEIVNLIDAIAFRTNILALNASIEASKAGEAGRGFAVVAQEVRALATRSAESSRQIADIVLRSTEDIDLGAALADETGRALQASDAHVDRIHQAISGVAQLTSEGERESAAILEGVRALSEVTHRNTSLVEQLALAGRSLQSQGSMLSDQVGQFRLSADVGLD